MAGVIKDLLSRVMGLSDDEQEALNRDLERLQSDAPAVGDELESTLPGFADERFEIFLSADDMESTDLATADVAEKGNKLSWHPIIREGQHAVRPGKFGQKVKRKLVVVAGKSKNQAKEIGLEDILEAFDADAVENVTVPVQVGLVDNAHANTTLQNTGFIRKLKISDAKIVKGPNKGKTVKHLFGGYDFTEPGVKGKVDRGTIAGRSAGLLYDYTNTETGKTWPVVLEHVALTQKPWIRGMAPFGRAIALSDDVEWTPFNLSEGDEDEELFEGETELFADVAGDASGASSTIIWTKEESPNWLRQQVDNILCEARRDKYKARRGQTMDVYEEIPRYRCVEAKPGTALVADGWSDDSNFWSAGFSSDKGEVNLDDFSKWTPLKKVYAKDDRQPPPKKDEPLSETLNLSELERARRRRRENFEDDPSTNANNNTPRGGEQEVSEHDATQLSEAAAKRIADLEAKLGEADRQRDEDRRKIDLLLSGDTKTRTASFLDELRSNGITEENGLGGVLQAAELYYSAADDDAVVQGAQFSEKGDDDKATLSLREVLEGVFSAFGEVKGIGDKLGLQLKEPSDKPLDKEGKPDPKADDGKPPADDLEDGKDPKEELSEGQVLSSFITDNPVLAKQLKLDKVTVGDDGKIELPALAAANGGQGR